MVTTMQNLAGTELDTAQLSQLDWEDPEKVNSVVPTALKRLAADKKGLGDLILKVKSSTKLLKMCEHYDILDKIVLHSDPSGFRLRMHVFLPGYIDRPHNHRWTYSTLILKGSYRHFLYLAPTEPLSEQTPVNSLRKVMVETRTEGSSYSLHHSIFHSICAEPYTVSLVIRGPSVKDKFLVMDKSTGSAWWQFGSQKESETERKSKEMTLTRLDFICKKLKNMNLI